MIQLHHLQKSFDHVHIGPLNMTFPKSGITSIIGPNGAGKSTTLLMIGRLLKADSGDIHVGNLNITTAKTDDIAKQLTILRQENHFITRLTVRQLIGFGRYPYSKGRLTQEDDAIITKYLDFFNLSAIEHHYLDELSGGQRQRAYVAMVLAQETEYILLDEPLNNLDVAHAVQMMQYLKKAAQQLGRTIILVIHDINFAARYSDYICAMKNGRIINFGTVRDIMTSKLLTELYDTPINIMDGPHGPIAIY